MWIYVIENLVNGKKYVGQTIQNPKDRWDRHCSRHPFVTAIHSAISKYGKENFKFEVIDSAKSLEELNKKESVWIEKLGTFGNGYNISKGGNGYPKTKETKAKISAKLKGIKKPHFNKPVICVNTGQEFESQIAACKYFGLGRNAVYESIKLGRKTNSGLIFVNKE